jgi:hypothetical protein
LLFCKCGGGAARGRHRQGKLTVAQTREVLARLGHSRLAELSKAQLRALRERLREMEQGHRHPSDGDGGGGGGGE